MPKFSSVSLLITISTVFSTRSDSERSWGEKGVSEGDCLAKMPEHVPIDTAWVAESFESGFYAPLGSESYFYEYSRILKDAPLNASEEVHGMCLRVTNAGMTNTDEFQKLVPNAALLKSVIAAAKAIKSTVKTNYVQSFLLIHSGFNNKIIEDCSSGVLGQKSCKITKYNPKTDSVTKGEAVPKADAVTKGEAVPNAESVAKGNTSTAVPKTDALPKTDSVTNRHSIKWTISLTDNSTFGVVIKCLTHLNQRAWVLMSTSDHIHSKKREMILAHVRSLGFKEDYVFKANYTLCKDRFDVTKYTPLAQTAGVDPAKIQPQPDGKSNITSADNITNGTVPATPLGSGSKSD